MDLLERRENNPLKNTMAFYAVKVTSYLLESHLIYCFIPYHGSIKYLRNIDE